MPKSTVQHIIKRFRETGELKNRKRTGRKPIPSPKEVAKVKRKVEENPFLSAPKLATQINRETGKQLNPRTVQKIINKNGLKGRTPRKKPYIRKLTRSRDVNLLENTN